jgi:nucleotidyltransferase/DNA polymerase involved in DNA repair
VQIVLIDEAYLDLTGTEHLHGTAWVAARKIQRAVARPSYNLRLRANCSG